MILYKKITKKFLKKIFKDVLNINLYNFDIYYDYEILDEFYKKTSKKDKLNYKKKKKENTSFITFGKIDEKRYAMIYIGKVENKKDYVRVVLHELGHLIDRLYGFISNDLIVPKNWGYEELDEKRAKKEFFANCIAHHMLYNKISPEETYVIDLLKIQIQYYKEKKINPYRMKN